MNRAISSSASQGNADIHVKGVLPQNILSSVNRHGQGFSFDRSQMIEATAVFDEERFERTRDLFAEGGFYGVKGGSTQVLSRFDLGEGGLIPFPIYHADLVTPIKGKFFLLNFGARKNSFLLDQSINVAKFSVTKTNGSQIWKVHGWYENDDVALSPAALLGPDLWLEEAIYSKIFMSDALA